MRVPKLYIRELATLEDFVAQTQANKAKLKMNAANARSFHAMRQKVKKIVKEYEQQLEHYRKVALESHMPHAFFFL